MRPAPSPALPLVLAATAALVAAGCASGGSGAVFGNHRSSSRQQPAYDNPYEDDDSLSAWESRRAPASSGYRRERAPDPRAAAARESTRVAQLEATVASLQSQLNAMSAAQADVVAQAGATVSRSGAVVDTVRGDIDSLRAELAALRAENRALKEEQARQKAQMDALPDQIVAKINAIMPKAPPPAPRQQSSSQRRASEGWEHTVSAGDTLSAIANAYGVRQSDIIRENGMKDANSLRVGQKLFIPKY